MKFSKRFHHRYRSPGTTPFIQRRAIDNSADRQFISHGNTGSTRTSAQTIMDVENNLQDRGRSGEALPHSTQAQMEQVFDADFTGVRIHTDRETVDMNQQLHAQAFTYGPDIYFNQGQYAPDTDSGSDLLAHELTHVIQQSGGQPEVQMRAMPGFTGTHVGEVEADIMSSRQRFALSARQELVPHAQTPGEFTGYSLEYEALARALLHTSGAVIVEDRDHRFHAFAADWPLRGTSQSSWSLAPVEASADFSIVRWVNIFQEQRLAGRSWQERVLQAEALREAFSEGDGSISRSQVEVAYVSLLRDALNLGTSEIHVMSSLTDRRPGRVNFFLELDHAQAMADVERLPTTEEGESNPGGDLQEPVTIMGPLAFHEESPVFTRAVFLHELEHMRHQLRSQALWRQWLAYRQRRFRQHRQPEDFRIWLFQEVGGHRISDEDYAVARQFASPTAGHANTETLAHEAAFENSFHLIPVRGLRESQAFHELYFMVDYGMTADPQIKRQVYARMETYYCQLDSPHRAWFDEYVDSQVTQWQAAVERFGEATQRQGPGAAALGRFQGFSRLAEFRDRCGS